MFWDRGFDAVSLPELERACGLNRSSIYNSFGSKRGLYDAAVRDYRENVVGPLLARLSGSSADPSALAEYLNAIARAVGGAPGADRGCLLLNSAAGLAAHDEVQRHVVDDYRRELHDAVYAALGSALPALSDGDRSVRARLLVAAVLAAMLLARINSEEAERTVADARALLLR
ncbi:TetR/AcrR family transcriptional regulator [Mycetocola reblochoni]|uniref:TetR/AcrR family transcriptional regulator n=1 Tax=Mycetocola reblochoni TaxID=331618 RepID=A0A3L6ZU07_9MICO|nr:TetR/AcrR family transcriptional regulator [Mycetocola reblochoni]